MWRLCPRVGQFCPTSIEWRWMACPRWIYTVVSLVEKGSRVGMNEKCGWNSSPLIFPLREQKVEKERGRRSGCGGHRTEGSSYRKWASRSKSHPRASYASGNRSALWPRPKHFPAPKNLGLRGFMDFKAQVLLLAACFCKVLRKDSVATLSSSLSFRRGRCFFFLLGLRDPVKRTAFGLIHGS